MDLVDLIRANVKHAQRDAKRILADPNTVILDTETTGLSNAYICDLAVIAKGRTVVNTLVNPGMHIPRDASAIHGIYDRHVKNAPTFAEIWPQLGPILDGSRIVIYNAAYDIKVLSNELTRLDTLSSDGSMIKWNVEDALTLYQRWYFGGVGRSGRNQTKLVNPHCDAPACITDVETHAKSGAHRAYADCLATVARLKMIANTCWLEDHWRNARKK